MYHQFILILVICLLLVFVNANREIHKHTDIVGAESDHLVNICSFAVCCDRRWPSTQWHMIYTGSDNVPYVQFESVGDFIS